MEENNPGITAPTLVFTVEGFVLMNLEQMLRQEWLETNGLGGFASATVSGIHTRRYHGLLIAATKPPVGRMLLLSKMEETLIWQGRRIDLSANRYPDGVIHPRGFELLASFRLDPFPVFVYQLEGAEVTKRVFMPHGENTVVIEYDLPAGASIELRPLIAFRDYHSTTHENRALRPAVNCPRDGVASVAPYPDLPALYVSYSSPSTLETSGNWYRNFEYSVERERGLDFREDLFQPFVLRCDGPSVSIIASTEPHHEASEAAAIRAAEVARRKALRDAAPVHNPLVEDLTVAADQFLVKRGDMKTVIAGYHWFSDWGRDTMIALPGLTLVTGRYELAKSILLAFAGAIDQGMLPNRFPDAGEAPEYNTVDATLWFFEAVRAYIAYSGDLDFVAEQILPKLREIIDWHRRGTRYGIRVDDDGLLQCGEPGVQLTWMDAKVGDWVVTPRDGKPVEIQALWYNALCIMEKLSPGDGYADLAAKASKSFNRVFWNAEAGCLYDVIGRDGRPDASIRPNQIFAVSLPHSMLTQDRARALVEVVHRELLTPAGLRSLAPGDAQYRGRYEGGVWERDSAYHQGTVWQWLLGPFITAYVKVNGGSTEARAQAAEWLKGFDGKQVAEIADGDPPHTSRGCIQQAWSIAELLRAGCEDVAGVKPFARVQG